MTSNETMHATKTSRQNERLHKTRRTRGLAAAVGAATTALAIGLTTITYETVNWDHKMADYQSAEQTAIGNWQRKGIPESTANFLLRAGVVYKTTPNDTSTAPLPWLKSNVAGEVKKGQVMLVRQPIWLSEPNGTVWMGFEINTGSSDVSNTALNEAEIEKKLDWVDYSQIKNSKANTKPMVSILKSGNSVNGSVAMNGQILSSSGSPAAYAFKTNTTQYQEFNNFFSPTS